jgi:anti-sigma factor RsiW
VLAAAYIQATLAVFCQVACHGTGGVAAAFILAFTTLSTQLAQPNGVRQQIAHEVLTNHLKIKALDVETGSMRHIQTFFDRLDFEPRMSAQLGENELTLIGGRYCTIQGAIAAQLKFKTPEGRIVTYYQAAYDRKRFGALPDTSQGARPAIINERGHQMHIWQESGLVMVTAQSNAHSSLVASQRPAEMP